MKGLVVLVFVGVFLFLAVAPAVAVVRNQYTVPWERQKPYTGPASTDPSVLPPWLRPAEAKADEPLCPCSKEQVATAKLPVPIKVAAVTNKKPAVAKKVKKAAKKGREGEMSEGMLALAIIAIAIVVPITIAAIVAMATTRRGRQTPPCAGHNGGHTPSRTPQPQAGQANAPLPTRQPGGTQGP